MERRQARYGLMSALLALILAVFVLIPTADAATCAIEAEASHSAALTLEDAGDEPVEPADHAACPHGHGHHGGTTVPSSPQHASADPITALRLLRPASEPLASRAPSGLERPPRA